MKQRVMHRLCRPLKKASRVQAPTSRIILLLKRWTRRSVKQAPVLTQPKSCAKILRSATTLTTKWLANDFKLNLSNLSILEVSCNIYQRSQVLANNLHKIWRRVKLVSRRLISQISHEIVVLSVVNTHLGLLDTLPSSRDTGCRQCVE